MEFPARTVEIRETGHVAGRGQVACSHCSLAELCLPRGLTPDGVQRFEQIVNRSRPTQAGEHLFRAGDPLRTIATVRAGCFKSYVTDRDGKERVLGFHLPGEIIGLDAIHACRHTANVVALETSAVCTLAFDSVTSMARHMPELQAELFRIMSARISDLEMIVGDLSTDERFAMFLLSLSQRFARRGYSERDFILAMSRRDIASYLRLATETVSRVLTRFQQAGLLRVNRKQVRIRDLDELRRVARQAAC